MVTAANIDHRLTMATECRRRAAEAANLAYLNGQAEREAEARHHVQVLTRHIDTLLGLRAKEMT